MTTTKKWKEITPADHAKRVLIHESNAHNISSRTVVEGYVYFPHENVFPFITCLNAQTTYLPASWDTVEFK